MPTALTVALIVALFAAAARPSVLLWHARRELELERRRALDRGHELSAEQALRRRLEAEAAHASMREAALAGGRDRAIGRADQLTDELATRTSELDAARSVIRALEAECAGDELEQHLGLEVVVHTPRPDDQSWKGTLRSVNAHVLELAGAEHSDAGPAAGVVLVPRKGAVVQVLGEPTHASVGPVEADRSGA